MVGTLIRQLREDRALTQGELAELVGLSTSALVRIEREQARPRLSTLRKLADALIVDVRELTGALRGTRPRESEDDIPPIADLAKLKVADDSATTLRARDALQRVAEDVVTSVVAGDSRLTNDLTVLEESARRLSGSVADIGFALAEFLSAIRQEEIERRHSPDLAQARDAARTLIAAARGGSHWDAEYRETCRAYAVLLLYGQPRAFHDAVGLFLLHRANLTIEGIAEPPGSKHSKGRRAIMALGTVLSLFDLVNGSRRDLASDGQEPKDQSTQQDLEDSAAEVGERRNLAGASP